MSKILSYVYFVVITCLYPIPSFNICPSFNIFLTKFLPVTCRKCSRFQFLVQLALLSKFRYVYFLFGLNNYTYIFYYVYFKWHLVFTNYPENLIFIDFIFFSVQKDLQTNVNLSRVIISFFFVIVIFFTFSTINPFLCC